MRSVCNRRTTNLLVMMTMIKTHTQRDSVSDVERHNTFACQATAKVIIRQHWIQRITFAAETNADTQTYKQTHNVTLSNTLSGGEGNNSDDDDELMIADRVGKNIRN